MNVTRVAGMTCGVRCGRDDRSSSSAAPRGPLALSADEHRARPMREQAAAVAVPAFTDAPETPAMPTGLLTRVEPQPTAKLTRPSKSSDMPHGTDRGRYRQQPDAGDLAQAFDRPVNPGNRVGSLTEGPRTHPAHAEGRLVYNGADRGSTNGNPGVRSSQTFSEGLTLRQLWTNRKNRI